MTIARKKVIELCDKIMQVNPFQIVIDFVQDEVEEVAYSENPTTDEIGALCYQCQNIIDIYNPFYEEDLIFLLALYEKLSYWNKESEFVTKTLGIDPNK